MYPDAKIRFFSAPGQVSLVFGFSGGLQTEFWKLLEPLFAVLDTLLGFFAWPILCPKSSSIVSPLLAATL